MISESKTLTLLPAKAARGNVRVPGSKSVSNRVLLLAALAQGACTLKYLLDSEDTEVMLAALKTLGVNIQSDSVNHATLVHGVAGQFLGKQAPLKLFLGNAGTALRPLTAVLALAGGHYELSGVARMHERPIADLVDALRDMGASITYLSQAGFPPIRISPAAIDASQVIAVKADVSSQFLTALLIASPLLAHEHDIHIEVKGELISRPYIDLTVQLMHEFGVNVSVTIENSSPYFIVPQGSRYHSPTSYAVEADASSASYFLAAGVLGQGPIRIEGVGSASLQGDIEFAHLLKAQGANILIESTSMIAQGLQQDVTQLHGGEIDCLRIPDAAMTLAITALFAARPTTLMHIGSWRVKETDRIAAMVNELKKIGAQVEASPDSLKIWPLAKQNFRSGVEIKTYQDHRIAMCFSLLALSGVSIVIADPQCVRKTYPEYFAHFQALLVYDSFP